MNLTEDSICKTKYATFLKSVERNMKNAKRFSTPRSSVHSASVLP